METYHGHVRTPADAIVLFEACRLGLLPRVQRRLSEKERQSIKSGSVFVWDEREAGMRRWTDGKSWSASRVSGSFLTYREMEGKRGGTNAFATPATTGSRGGKSPNTDNSDSGDDLEGPDGYRYKPDGLMKQSFSITTATHQKLHLISYYARSHPSSQNLIQPTQDSHLKHIRPVKGMYPESTVHEQQNVPAVTRGPMMGPMPHHSPIPSYSRQSVSHPVTYAQMPTTYAWPPSPVSTPPTGVQVPQYALHALPQPATPQSQMSYGGPGFTGAPHSHSNGGSPRSAHDRPSLPQLDGLSSQPPVHRGSIGSPLMALQHRSPRTTQAQPQRSTPPLSLPAPTLQQNAVDHYSSPAANNSPIKSPPPQSDKWDINPLRHSPEGVPADLARTGLDVQDIPSEKLGFREDVRALRVLDRAFAA